MATTKIWAIKTRLDTLIDYVTDKTKTGNKKFKELKSTVKYAQDETKTEHKMFVTGINCNPETAYRSMKAAHRKNTKKIRVLGYHAYQSFKSGEVTPQQAHEIGLKLAGKLWGDRFQVVVATHKNTKNIHNHFVVCSTSFLDGKRFHACKESYRKMREVSDTLCRQAGISVIEKPVMGRGKEYAEIRAEGQGRMTWRGLIREDIDKAAAAANTAEGFWSLMEQAGYELKMNVKYPAVRPPGHERFFRLYKLGDDYTSEALKKRIYQKKRRSFPEPERVKKRGYKLQGKINRKGKIKGFRALYLYYSYKLGILPGKKNTNRRMHFLLREDLLKMESFIDQSKLLIKNKIDTYEQLEDYTAKTTAKLEGLETKRKNLRKKVRRKGGNKSKDDLKREISEASDSIRKLKREMKHCEEIKERSKKMKVNLRKINSHEKEKRKEGQSHDKHGR